MSKRQYHRGGTDNSHHHYGQRTKNFNRSTAFVELSNLKGVPRSLEASLHFVYVISCYDVQVNEQIIVLAGVIQIKTIVVTTQSYWRSTLLTLNKYKQAINYY